MISSFPFFSQFEYYSASKAGKLPGWEATRLGSNNVADMVAVEQPIQKDSDGGVGILESDNNNNNNNDVDDDDDDDDDKLYLSVRMFSWQANWRHNKNKHRNKMLKIINTVV